MQLGDLPQITEDTLTYGNALKALGKNEDATKAFQNVLEMCLDAGNYANAASASTNLSFQALDRGEFDKAITLLNNSLEYLQREPFPETEANTRFALVQLMEQEQHEPQTVIDMANALHDGYGEMLNPDQRRVIAGVLSHSIERYLKAHPKTNGATWTAKHVPYLNEWNT
jgi:tetratricopeptide (TPR) repeat protein